MWGGGHSNCNASLSQPNFQKNSRVLVMGALKAKCLNLAAQAGGGGGVCEGGGGLNPSLRMHFKLF